MSLFSLCSFVCHILIFLFMYNSFLLSFPTTLISLSFPLSLTLSLSPSLPLSLCSSLYLSISISHYISLSLYLCLCLYLFLSLFLSLFLNLQIFPFPSFFLQLLLFPSPSAHYDPKARSMRANPFPNENPEDLAFAGDNFIRHTGTDSAVLCCTVLYCAALYCVICCSISFIYYFVQDLFLLSLSLTLSLTLTHLITLPFSHSLNVLSSVHLKIFMISLHYGFTMY